MSRAKPLSPPFDRAAFQTALLDWYRAHRRPLPWRTHPSLYRTVVSEFMLQQTQVKTALPYFDRWMSELPDFAALAAATEARVLKLWEGLGYYSRARNLHRLAQALAATAEIPRTPEAWRELPGVGPYMSAAITSIAFSAPVACVDGNVVRILARLTACSDTFRDSADAAKYFAPLAGSLLTETSPGDHNQAMMELGATVCHRQRPLCLTCPVRPCCAAARTGAAEELPRLAARQIERVSIVRLWCEQNGSLLLRRHRSDARRLANLHELPRPEDLGGHAPPAASTPLAVRRRAITRYAITESIFAAPAQPKLSTVSNPDLVWVPLADLDAIALSGPHRRWIRELLAARTPPGG